MASGSLLKPHQNKKPNIVVTDHLMPFPFLFVCFFYLRNKLRSWSLLFSWREESQEIIKKWKNRKLNSAFSLHPNRKKLTMHPRRRRISKYFISLCLSTIFSPLFSSEEWWFHTFMYARMHAPFIHWFIRSSPSGRNFTFSCEWNDNNASNEIQEIRLLSLFFCLLILLFWPEFLLFSSFLLDTFKPQITPDAEDKGIGGFHASFLLSAISIGSLLGKGFGGYFGDLWKSHLQMFIVAE